MQSLDAGGGPGWWEPCGLTHEPVVLLLARATAVRTVWCLASCIPLQWCGRYLGGVPRTVREAERSCRVETLAQVLPDRDGGVDGHRPLLEGIVEASVFHPSSFG